MELQLTQIVVFLGLTALIGFATYWACRGTRSDADGEKEYFLAGGGLKWYFVAGSITLTNLSTDQLVGMNGNQMALLAWWELAVGSAYAIFGGLRAVAVSDTFSGILLLSLAILVTVLALKAIGFDLSGIPKERLTLIGGPDSDIPWPTLFTGMLFIQIFYWSTNQTITQRAMASPNVKEAQKGILAAAAIRLLIVPPIIVIPGIVAFKLYGDIGDATYGRIVGDLLPAWLSGAFAAAIAAAVLTTFNSILNASAALWVCDIHETYIDKNPNVKRLSLWVSIVMVGLAFMLIPIFNNPEQSIINTVQRLYGTLSMPILAAFMVGLLFKNVDARAVIASVIFGVLFYYWMLLPLIEEQNVGLHYIHLMAINLFAMVWLSLALNRIVLGQRATWDAKTVFGKTKALGENI